MQTVTQHEHAQLVQGQHCMIRGAGFEGAPDSHHYHEGWRCTISNTASMQLELLLHVSRVAQPC